MFGAAGFVYLALFVVVGAVTVFNYRRTKRTMAASAPAADAAEVPGLGAVSAFVPFLSFFTLVTVAVVPLAAALYVVTSTAWSAVERAVLYP